MSVFPSHAPWEGLSSVLSSDEMTHLPTALDGLLDKGFLEHDPGSNVWSIRHEWIREYVLEKTLRRSFRNDLERRAAEYYAMFLLANPNNYDRQRAESVNILGTAKFWRRKHQGARSDYVSLFEFSLDVDHAEALHLVYLYGRLAHRSGDSEWAAQLYANFSEPGVMTTYPIISAEALRQQANLNWYSGDHELAIAKLERAIETARSASEEGYQALARACRQIGEFLMRNQQTERAEQYLTEGLQAAKHCSDELLRTRIAGSLVYVYRTKEEFERAYELYRTESRSLSGEPLGTLLIGVAEGLIEQGEFSQAQLRIEEAREIFSERSNLGGVAYTFRLEGKIYFRQANYGRAEEMYQKEEAYRQEDLEQAKGYSLEEREFLLECLRHEHAFYLAIGELQKAERVRTKYSETKPEPDYVVASMLDQEAALLLSNGDLEQALRKSTEALNQYRETDNIGGQAWVKRIQGDILVAQGYYGSAYEAYAEGVELRNVTDEPEHTAEDLEHFADFIWLRLNDKEQACEILQRAKLEYGFAQSDKTNKIDRKLNQLGCIEKSDSSS